MVFSGVCLLKLQSLSAESARLDESITALEQQLLDEKERQLDEKTMQEYYQSDEYKEQLAREKFNLIKPGERLYVFGGMSRVMTVCHDAAYFVEKNRKILPFWCQELTKFQLCMGYNRRTFRMKKPGT